MLASTQGERSECDDSQKNKPTHDPHIADGENVPQFEANIKTHMNTKLAQRSIQSYARITQNKPLNP